MLLLSCKQTRGVNAVVIYKDGYLLSKSVTKIDKGLGLYPSYIEGFKRAFSHLRCFIERGSIDDGVTIECNSSIFVGWLKSCETKKDLEASFLEMWRELDRLPIQYSVVYNSRVSAENYAKESYIEKEKLQSLEV